MRGLRSLILRTPHPAPPSPRRPPPTLEDYDRALG
jgi:hypothetical protein